MIPENLFSLVELMQTIAKSSVILINCTEVFTKNRKRNIQLKIWVTAEERKLIEHKMSLVPTNQIGAYLRKMAIDGYIIYTDTKDIQAMNKELQRIGRNINQIAKRVNSTSSIYMTDIEELKEDMEIACRRLLCAVHGC